MVNPAHRSEVHQIEHLWIPMADGVRLSARLWLPKGDPAPAVFEYIPYRKRDMVRARDERNHPFLAAHGYACLRVDMRGSGDSEGIMPDMYDPHELDDARQVIAWIAEQPWCTGRVGMFGTSWGGTASLQASVDAPEPLKAVVANCATIDRFEDDIHWMGGCLLTDSIEWGATLPGILAAPPDAATVGECWQEMWRDRLETLTHPLENWINHKTRGEYWRHGSVRFDADRLSCPILSIGGWADRYSNSVMRLVSARPDVSWGILGPWGHHYPDHGEPSPAISFQHVALDWWDHWLKTPEPAPPTWPRLRVWHKTFDPPQDRLTERKGHWLETNQSEPGAAITLALGSGLRSGEDKMVIPSDLLHGGAAGDTGYFGRQGGLPLNQSADDDRGVIFETEPLEKEINLFGHAALSITLQNVPSEAQLICRICDVAPDGRSNLVTRAVLNLARDDMLDQTLDLTNGDLTRKLTLPSTSYRFTKGHRLRVVLAQSYWPLVFPTAQGDLDVADMALHIPGLPSDARPLQTAFPPAQQLPNTPSWEPMSSGPLTRTLQHWHGEFSRMGWHQPLSGAWFPEENLTLQTETKADYAISPKGVATCTFRFRIVIDRADGQAEVISQTQVHQEDGTISVEANLEALWDGVPEATHHWAYTGEGK